MYIYPKTNPGVCPGCHQCFHCGRPIIQPVIRPGTPYWRVYQTDNTVDGTNQP